MPSKTELPAELEPPPHPRRLRFHRTQLVAVPLLLLIPVLAMFGVFGESQDRGHAATSALHVQVEYMSRFRYKQVNTVEVRVQNTSAEPLDTVRVAFDPAYVRKFSILSFIPSPTEPFVVELLNLAPGEVQRVWAELEGAHYGSHRGYVKAYAAGSADTAAVALETVIFP